MRPVPPQAAGHMACIYLHIGRCHVTSPVKVLTDTIILSGRADEIARVERVITAAILRKIFLYSDICVRSGRVAGPTCRGEK